MTSTGRATSGTNVRGARAAGVNLAFFSGNEMYWKTRWEPSIDGSATANRTLVSYKETMANGVGGKIDPTATWTGTWRDPRFSPPADGGRPENAVSGQIWAVNCFSLATNCAGTTMEVPAADGRMRFWRNSTVATLAATGVSSTLPSGTLGYEADENLDNGVQPAGLVRLSTTTRSVDSRIEDYGIQFGPGLATHHMTLYRHASGALVFGAGTIRWSWGLDTSHDAVGGEGWPTPDPSMQQATANVLADMGSSPVP